MRVAFHTDTFARRHQYGLSRYATSVATALRECGVDVMPFSTQSEFGDDPPEWLHAAGFIRIGIPRKYLATSWSILQAPRVDWILPKFDVLHSIDVDYAAPTNRPWIATFHDLGPLVRPEFFGDSMPWLLRRYVNRAIKRADRIVCVSEATANEVLAIARTSLGDRLKVIPEGVGPEFLDDGGSGSVDDSQIPEVPFFLFCGSMNPRKNLRRVLRAFIKAASSIPHHLILTGTLGWDSAELATDLERLRASGRIHTPGYVSDAVLRAMLDRASGFLYPSLYEGFGLPILEAMARACPVITSNQAPMAQVAGGCALLVDPLDEEAIADAILRLASDRELAGDLSRAGVKHARGFTWAETARRTAALYAEVT